MTRLTKEEIERLQGLQTRCRPFGGDEVVEDYESPEYKERSNANWEWFTAAYECLDDILDELIELRKKRKRIELALRQAEYGGFDGAHHKMWTIDQMVRALTGCPFKELVVGYSLEMYEALGESKEYIDWVAAYQLGDEGAETYEWDTGVAPLR